VEHCLGEFVSRYLTFTETCIAVGDSAFLGNVGVNVQDYAVSLPGSVVSSRRFNAPRLKEQTSGPEFFASAGPVRRTPKTALTVANCGEKRGGSIIVPREK
jgi:hypothetical protein